MTVGNTLLCSVIELIVTAFYGPLKKKKTNNNKTQDTHFICSINSQSVRFSKNSIFQSAELTPKTLDLGL